MEAASKDLCGSQLQFDVYLGHVGLKFYTHDVGNRSKRRIQLNHLYILTIFKQRCDEVPCCVRSEVIVKYTTRVADLSGAPVCRLQT